MTKTIDLDVVQSLSDISFLVVDEAYVAAESRNQSVPKYSIIEMIDSAIPSDTINFVQIPNRVVIMQRFHDL